MKTRWYSVPNICGNRSSQWWSLKSDLFGPHDCSLTSLWCCSFLATLVKHPLHWRTPVDVMAVNQRFGSRCWKLISLHRLEPWRPRRTIIQYPVSQQSAFFAVPPWRERVLKLDATAADGKCLEPRKRFYGNKSRVWSRGCCLLVCGDVGCDCSSAGRSNYSRSNRSIFLFQPLSLSFF